MISQIGFSVIVTGLLMMLMNISGCKEKPFLSTEIRDVKYCHSACIKNTFENFHSDGWGTSSMDGMSQSKVFDRVERYCKEFYQNERCCKMSDKNYNIETLHGYRYGPCNLNMHRVDI